MYNFGINSLCLFDHKENIRLIIYKNTEQISLYTERLILFMNNYSLIIIQTIYFSTSKLISNLGLFNNNKTIYVLHNLLFYNKLNFSRTKYKNRVWTLTHFSVGLQVTPYYIGKTKLKDKNYITSFFIISTGHRNYKYLITAAERLKEENFDFLVYVIGYRKTFSINDINEKIKNNFIFNYRVNFSTLYNVVDNSDYIIINLDPDKDKNFKDKKVTGAAQLSLGFIKPILINTAFKSIYNRTKENSFLFDKSNFYNVMKDAIKLNNRGYKNMQKNLLELTRKIHEISVINIKKTLNSLLFNQ